MVRIKTLHIQVTTPDWGFIAHLINRLMPEVVTHPEAHVDITITKAEEVPEDASTD